MKMIGNDVHIQRGETWSLDFSAVNKRGQPLTLLKIWENPYLVITVTAALYEQKGDFRHSYWLDLSNRWVELPDGSTVLEPIKKFISTEALFLPTLTVADAISYYGVANGGRMVLDTTSDFDVTNYLFFVDPASDGDYIYKYVKSYTLDDDGEVDEANVEWADYDFRVVKQFTTRDWMEQRYLFDIKILAGEHIMEHIARILEAEGATFNDLSLGEWSDEETQRYINMIQDDAERAQMQELFEDGVPLMPDYDIKSLILEPTNLYVSTNIQGGVK